MKVYVLLEYCGELQGNHGVFSSKEKAEEAIGHLDASGKCEAEWLFIEEYMLDELMEVE